MLYRRYSAGMQRTFSLRSFSFDDHCWLFCRWMNDPEVAVFWEMAWEPFAYFEVYWSKEDRLGPYYDAHDFDRGFHMAVGDQRFRFRGLGKHWFLGMAHFLFLDDPRTMRLVGEPRVDQDRVRGWAKPRRRPARGLCDLPDRRPQGAGPERDHGRPFARGDTFLAGVATTWMGALTGRVVLVVIGATILVAGVGMLQASVPALVSLLSRSEERGVRMGMRDSSSAFGRILGPVAGGLAFQVAGAAWPLVMAELMALMGLAVLLAIAGRLRAIEQPRS